MKVNINGEEKQFAEQMTLDELLKNLELPVARIAVELNQTVVRRTAWDKTIIKENDKIEIVHFVGGGFE